jgi:hypothetical protein
MPYTDPTAATFVVSYPEFEDREADEITKAISAAKRMVDQSWTEGDYTRAIELYAAHLLVKADIAAATGGEGGGIQSESLGPVNVSYARPSTVDVSGLSATTYGAEFAILLRLNRGGARAV